MYDVYLDGLLLPVAPEKITTQINGRNETATLIDEGEINILRSPGLTTVSFTALLPNVPYPFARYPGGFQGAGVFLDKLEQLKTEKRAFQFIVTRRMPTGGQLPNTNLTCALEEYAVMDDARSGGFDLTVRITLKQYRAYGTKTFQADAPSPGAPTVVVPERPASTAPANGTGRPSSGSAPRTQAYKVQIPGMAALNVEASSAQEAIAKAGAQSWTGTIYVNGATYYVEKGTICEKPAPSEKPDAVEKAVQQTARSGSIGETLEAGVKALDAAAKKTGAATRKPTTVKKAVTRDQRFTMVTLN